MYIHIQTDDSLDKVPLKEFAEKNLNADDPQAVASAIGNLLEVLASRRLIDMQEIHKVLGTFDDEDEPRNHRLSERGW